MFGCCRRGNFYICSHTNTFLTFFFFSSISPARPRRSCTTGRLKLCYSQQDNLDLLTRCPHHHRPTGVVVVLRFPNSLFCLCLNVFCSQIRHTLPFPSLLSHSHKRETQKTCFSTEAHRVSSTKGIKNSAIVLFCSV